MSLLEKAREVLKALGQPPSAVPSDPAPDPDRVDPRAEGASPTEDSHAEAAEGAAAAGAAQGEPDGDEDEDEDGDGGEFHKAMADADEHFDMSEDEARDFLKSFGGAYGATDPERAQDALQNVNVTDLLTEIINVGKAQGRVLTAMAQSLRDLQKVNSDLGRDVAKSLETAMKAQETASAALDRVQSAHLTAPPAPGRAVAKAADPGAGMTPKALPLSAGELFRVALSGKMDTLEIAALNRSINASH